MRSFPLTALLFVASAGALCLESPAALAQPLPSEQAPAPLPSPPAVPAAPTGPPAFGAPPATALPMPPPWLLQPLPQTALWRKGDPIPDGYRVHTTYNLKLLLGGAGVLMLGMTATTLIASGIAYSSFFGAFALPMSGLPVIGPFPTAAGAVLSEAGPGTIGALFGLGAVQIVGFGMMMGAIAKRKPSLVPACATTEIAVAPFAAPGAGGLTLWGSL